MYEGLLLSTGGGIITDIKKSAYQGEPAIIIGLGGTGIDALKAVRKKVYENILPDDPAAAEPEYKHIKFLAVDTDCESFKGLAEEECMDIRVSNMAASMERAIWTERKEFNWLEEDLGLLGGGRVFPARQVGRYCLFKNIDKITERIRELKTDVNAGSGDSEINVHIITGITGVTGGGTFIDMCYIIRDLLGAKATLFGYFFMPDVNLNKTGIDKNVAGHIKSNGYASLKELDYTMNLGNEGKTFSQYYGGSTLYSIQETSMPLVDVCHLISATEQNGTSITNGYMHSMHIVGEFILPGLLRNEGENVKDIDALGKFFGPVKHAVVLEKRHGANLNYHILGASAAEIPTKEIGTYLAAKLYKKLEKGLVEKEPNDSDARRHADAMELRFSSFKEKLGDGINDAYEGIGWDSNDFSIEDILNTKIISNGAVVEDTYESTSISMRKIILGPARKWESDNKIKLQKNFDKLTKDLGNLNAIGQGANATSFISNVFKYLQNDIVMDFRYGAVYASKLTHNDWGFSLNDRLSGIIREAAEAKEHRISDMQLRVKDIINSVKFCREKCTGIFATKKKQQEGIERYKNSIRAYYQNVFDIEVYQKVIEMADILKNQIDKDGYPNSLYPNYFKPLEKMLIELKATFEENSRFFNEPATNNDELVLKIVEFKEVQERVDHGFGNIVGNGVSGAYKSFVRMLMEQHDKWAYGDRNKVEKMITSYISDMFEPVLSTSMDSYLNDKYGTHGNPVALQKKIETDLLTNGVLAKANPKFHINGAYTIDTVKQYELSVPEIEYNVRTAALSTGLDVKIKGLNNRITAVKREFGIPLYAYGLIDELERQYNAGGIGAVGRHLYEITDRNRDINWTNLQSFIPYSLEPEACADGKELEKLYYEAVNRGIIAVNQDNPDAGYNVYALKKPTKKNRDDFMNTDGNLDVNKLKFYVEELENYIDSTGKFNADSGNNANIEDIQTLLNDGSTAEDGGGDDYREICRIDYFIRFRGLQEVVKESMKILDDVEVAIKEAAKWRNESAEREETIKLIADALCFDLFEKGIDKYTYNGVDLWAPAMEYGEFPVYQIYKTFSSDAFTDTERKALGNDVNNKLNTLEPADAEKVEKVKAGYIDDTNIGIDCVMKQAAVLSEYGDIETVYKLFEKEIQALLRLFEM